jgi:hypothetical protein
MTDISVIDPQNKNAIFRLGFLPAFTQGRFHLSHKIGFVNIDKLVESLNSFTMTDVYFSWCYSELSQLWGEVAEIGQTLSEASDIIMDGWLSRSAAQDIMAYQYNDSVRGVEKVWDPDGQNVYEFEAGWYDQYQLNPGQYNISTLEPMPDGRVDLWEGTILDGSAYVYQN